MIEHAGLDGHCFVGFVNGDSVVGTEIDDDSFEADGGVETVAAGFGDEGDVVFDCQADLDG